MIPEEVKYVEWFMNGLVIKPTKKHVVLYENDKKSYSLIINDLTKFDSGEYTCKITSKSGQFLSSCTLNIEQPKVIEVTPEEPKLKKSLDKAYEFNSGDSAK